MTPRYFKNDAPLSSRDPRRQLEASLTRLVTTHPPAEIKPGGGLFKGPVSVAFTLLMLDKLYPALPIEGQTLGTWSAAYLKHAQDNIASYPGPRAGHCGVTDDILALLAIGAATSKDAGLVNDLCDYSLEATDPETENELLYGRAGYLYLLRQVKAAFAADVIALPPTDEKDGKKGKPPELSFKDKLTVRLITDTQHDVIDAILDSPRPWRWHGKFYTGALHGAIGIITQIVLTDPERYAPKMEAELMVLLSYQYPSGGNFPSSVPPPERDRLVQFCHGAPGVVISLLSIKKFFPALETKIDKAIDNARECILERGLLTKEPCLCHGISGNALALNDKEFEHFLTYTTGNEMKSMGKDGLLDKSSCPESLFGGEAGRAWAWAVADLGLPKRVLGFNEWHFLEDMTADQRQASGLDVSLESLLRERLRSDRARREGVRAEDLRLEDVNLAGWPLENLRLEHLYLDDLHPDDLESE